MRLRPTPIDFNADWGRSSWAGNRSQNFNLVATWNAPRGFGFSPMIAASSAQPYGLTTGVDFNGDTIANDRPAFATDLSRPSVVLTRFGAFDTEPIAGQVIVPRNFLTGKAIWTVNARLSGSITFGPHESGTTGSAGRYALLFSIDVTMC